MNLPIKQLKEIERTGLRVLRIHIRHQRTPYYCLQSVRSAPRRTSDIAHEFAHILLEHDLTEIQNLNGIPFRTCQPDQEEQATALGGTLLLPRPALLGEAHREATVEQIARKFGVTKQMAQFRWNTTGVQRQAAAAKAARTRRPT